MLDIPQQNPLKYGFSGIEHIVIITQRELSGGRKHSGRAPSDSGSRHSSAASSSTAHRIDSGSHMSAKDRIVSADSGE